MTHFEVGSRQLPIVRTARQKSIAIKSTASTQFPLQLLVPRHLSERALRTLLQRHRDWIESRLDAHLHRQQQTSAWPLFAYRREDKVVLLGESIPVVWQQTHFKHASTACLLRQEALHIQVSNAVIAQPACEFDADFSRGETAAPGLLGFSEAQKFQVKRQLQNWYLQQAQVYFANKVPDLAKQIGVSVSAVQVKTYKARWGSCYPDGRIQFNWKLLQAPDWVVDYVIVHELCHLHHANHSPAFWALVNHHYPLTRQAKQWLKSHGMALMAFLSD